MIKRYRTLVLSSLVAVGACSSAPAPLRIAPGGAVSIDGLVRLDNTIMAIGEAKPGLDLTRYTAFILDQVTVAYQKDPGNVRRNSIDSNFALTRPQMEELQSLFQREVEKALTENDGYDLVSVAGPNVAVLTPYLIDLIVRVPTDRPGGRSDTYVSSYGEVTMVIELRDSQTNEILARAADRADPTRSSYQLVEVSPSFMRADVTRLFRHWATSMRDRIDELRALGPLN